MAAGLGLDIAFRHMDAQLDFGRHLRCRSAGIGRGRCRSRRKPTPSGTGWLKPGGLLLPDADYAANVRSESFPELLRSAARPYGHVGMTEALVERKQRHHFWRWTWGQKRLTWDEAVPKRSVFHCRTDLTVGRRVLGALTRPHTHVRRFAQK